LREEGRPRGMVWLKKGRDLRLGNETEIGYGYDFVVR